MAIKHIKIPSSAGSGAGWGGSLALRSDYPEELIVDMTDVPFVLPLLLIRLRTFVDWHQARGRKVTVLMPKKIEVRRYMARMHVGEGAADGTYDNMPEINEQDRSEALLPVSALTGEHSADHICEDLTPILENYTDNADLPQAVHVAMSELANNAVEHGELQGCYMAVQRYPKLGVLRIAVSDLGIGIPNHIRRQNPQWDDDAAAVERALQAGVSGTGDPQRGNGLTWMIEELENSGRLTAEITFRSGGARCDIRVPLDGEKVVSATEAKNKLGTTVSLTFNRL